MQIKLWPTNEAGLKTKVDQSKGLLTITKIANFAIACYLTAKKGKKKP